VTYPEDWVLYCVSKYPTPLNKVDFRNLSRLETLYPIWGFSDHTVGHGAAVIAAASGAKVIEKHFTMDRKLFGPDQVCSLEPDELKQMVAEIRSV
jgi:sialic acid synthase SpsE